VRIAWSKHTTDWVKLCYDFLKITVSLLVLGPIVTQKAVSPIFASVGLFLALAFFGLAVYLKERG
jgi:hypothetical protein